MPLFKYTLTLQPNTNV